jgi:hypothetical protein
LFRFFGGQKNEKCKSKKVSHPERAAVTESEYKFLIKLSSWLLPNISDLENQNTDDITEEYDDELND